MKHIIAKIGAGVLAVLLLAGCVSAPTPVADDGGPDPVAAADVTVYMTLQLSGAGPQTRALTTAQQEQINFVDILVFDDSPEHLIVDWQYGHLENNGGDVSFSAKLRASADQNERFRVMALVNVRDVTYGLFGDDRFDNYKGVANYATVCAALSAAVPAAATLATKGLPMWGELEGDVVIDKSNNSYDMTLLRSVARVDVGTNPDPAPAVDQQGHIVWKALGNFTLEQVYVYNASTRYALTARANYDFDDEKVGAATLPAANGRATAPVQYAVANDVDTSADIYVGEANVRMGGTYGDANHPNRMALVVAGYYSPDPATPNTTTLSYYRIDFTQGTNGSALMDILRNNDYQMIIKSVSGPGSGTKEKAFEKFAADMTVVVKTWSEPRLAGTVFDGEYFLKATPYDLEIDKWGGNQTVLLETNVPAVAGKSWEASVVGGGGWLTLSAATSGVSGDQLVFDVEPVPNGSTEAYSRSAQLQIAAGKMTYRIDVTQTGRDGDHLLRLSHSELVFAGRKWNGTAWTNPDPQTLTVNWGPRNHDYSLTLTDYTGGGVQGYTPPATSDNPVVSIAPSMIAPDDPRVAENPFFERSSILTVSASDQFGANPISKSVRIRQIFYSLVVERTYDYYFREREYSFVVRANSPWVATTDTPSFFSSLTASGSGDTAGQPLTFEIDDAVADGARATITISSPARLFDPQTFTIIAQQELPNSYIVAPGGGIEIPVKKTFHVWELDRDLKDLPQPPLAGTFTAELLWQDAQDLIESVDMVGTGRDARIAVRAKQGAGNAVVALRIDGTIWWSWHVWVTDYDPDQTPKHFAGYTVMDRNMGATSVTPGDVGVYGQYYGWGRKDPMPARSSNATTSPALPLFDIDNNAVVFPLNPLAPAQGGLPMSIHEPLSFLRTNWGSHAWTGQGLPIRGNLWGYYEKTDYDPCPKGWRVVQHDFITSLPAVPPFLADFGVDFGAAGFYPCAGFTDMRADGGFGSTVGDRPLHAYTEKTENAPGVARIIPGVEISVIESDLGRGWSIRCMKDE
jgi:hypothetical protein